MKKVLLVLFVILLCIFTVFIYYNRVIVVSTIDSKQLIKNNDTIELECLTYNIHHGVGIDGRLNLDRIARVMDESDAEIIGLNEVDMRRRRTGLKNQAAYLAEKLAMNYAYGPGKNSFPGSFGNAVLTKYPIINAENIYLPQIYKDSTESRSLLKVEIEIDDKRSLYVLVTHLSLDISERREQFRWINNYIGNLTKPYILMGDFNAGLPELQNYLDEDNSSLRPLISGVKTYPASNPISGIDLYFSDNQVQSLEGYSIKTNASDHFPVYLKIEL